MLKRRPFASLFAFAATIFSVSSARADESIIKNPGDHPAYRFEAEPHGLIGFGGPFRHGNADLGAGFRGTIILLDNGFVKTINNSVGIGFGGVDPAAATSIGQQVCPMLSQPGQDVADVAAKVADEMGRPLGPATMFTGLAIQIFCPGAVASIANGQSPIPLGLLNAF